MNWKSRPGVLYIKYPPSYNDQIIISIEIGTASYGVRTIRMLNSKRINIRGACLAFDTAMFELEHVFNS